jgi:hypothetical protein
MKVMAGLMKDEGTDMSFARTVSEEAAGTTPEPVDPATVAMGPV